MIREGIRLTTRRSMPLLAILLFAALDSGCSSQVPALIRKSPDDNPPLQPVRADVDAFLGRSVRWGGKIAEVQNLETETGIEVVALPLERRGRPRASGESDGRFLARIPGFIDPEVYKEGQLLTVFGKVSGQTERDIGEYRYLYPVVTAQAYYLWPPEIYYPYYYDPVLRDPFFYYGPYYYGPYLHY
ncbi:MAG: Slp family lipoprotein [Pseudomonadota bacterium]|nr:Slp family lipoprotein [Pseudomonadota bacterium]